MSGYVKGRAKSHFILDIKHLLLHSYPIDVRGSCVPFNNHLHLHLLPARPDDEDCGGVGSASKQPA